MNEARRKGKGRRNERANGDLHRVVLGLDVETLLLESLENSSPSVESFQSLEKKGWTTVSEKIRGDESEREKDASRN